MCYALQMETTWRLKSLVHLAAGGDMSTREVNSQAHYKEHTHSSLTKNFPYLMILNMSVTKVES